MNEREIRNYAHENSDTLAGRYLKFVLRELDTLRLEIKEIKKDTGLNKEWPHLNE